MLLNCDRRALLSIPCTDIEISDTNFRTEIRVDFVWMAPKRHSTTRHFFLSVFTILQGNKTRAMINWFKLQFLRCTEHVPTYQLPFLNCFFLIFLVQYNQITNMAVFMKGKNAFNVLKKQPLALPSSSFNQEWFVWYFRASLLLLTQFLLLISVQTSNLVIMADWNIFRLIGDYHLIRFIKCGGVPNWIFIFINSFFLLLSETRFELLRHSKRLEPNWSETTHHISHLEQLLHISFVISILQIAYGEWASDWSEFPRTGCYPPAPIRRENIPSIKLDW